MIGFTRLFSPQSESGQTVVEILIATGIVAMVMTAVVAGLAVSVRNSAEAKYRALAAKLAQDGIEVFRRERDRMGWETFRGTVQADGIVATYCVGSSLPATSSDFIAMTSSNNCTGTEFAQAGTSFTRQVEARVINDDTVEVIATVSWEDGTQIRSVEIEQELRNWR